MLTQTDRERIRKFFCDVEAELVAAVAKHGKFRNLHEAYGVLHEEECEFFDCVRIKEELRISGDVYKELVQIAAMAAKSSLVLEAQ